MLTNDGPSIANGPESDGYTCDVFSPIPVQVPVALGYGKCEQPLHERPQEPVRWYVAVAGDSEEEENDEVVDVEWDSENEKCK